MSETIGAAQIELGVDASGVDAGVARAKKSIDSLGDAAIQAGKGGAQGINDIGKAGTDSADKLDQATKRTIASIERQALALGKTRSEYYAAKAAIDGNAGALAPYIAKLAEAEKANKSLGDTNKGLGSSFEELAKAAGAVVSIGAIVASLKSAIDAADHLKDLNKVTGITVEQLAGLRLAAVQTGTELDSVAKAIGKMSVEMGKDPEKFAKLGITDKDSLKAFQQFADLLGNIPDLQKRNALSQAVLNKSWQEMAPLLSEGGKKIGEMVEKGTRLSGMTTGMAKAADEFNDKWAELTQTGGTFNRMLAPTLPLLIALADDMLAAQENTDKFKTSVSPLAEVLRATVILAGNVSFTFTTMGKDIARAIENVQLIAKGDFAGSRALGALFKKDAEDSRTAFDAWEKKMLEAGKTSAAVATVVVESSGKMTAAQQGASAAADGFLNADKAEAKLTDFQKLMKSATELRVVLEAQAGSNDKLTESEKKLVQGLYDIDHGMKGVGKGSRELFETEMQRAIAAEKTFKISQDVAKAEAERVKTLADSTGAIEKEAIAIREHTAEIGLSKEEISARKAALDDDTIALREQELATLDATNRCTPYSEALRDNILALKERAAALKVQSTVEASAEAAKKSAEEWKRGWEETDRIGREVFANWKNAGKTVGDALKKALLSAIYEATAKPIMLQMYAGVTNALGVPGAAGGANALGVASSAYNAYSAYNAGTTPYQGLLASISNNKYGNMMLGGESSSMTANLQAGAEFLDSYGGYISAFAQLANGNTAGAIGAAVGQYFGGPIGAAIGSAIMSKVGGGHNGSAYTTGYQMYGSVTPTGYTQTAMYALASDQAGHSFADAMPTGSLSNDMAFLNSLKDAIVSALTSAGKSTGLDPSKAIAALNIPINLGYSAGATDTQIIAARAKVGLDALNTALDQFAASLGMTQADMQQIISAKSAQKSLLDSLATEKEKLTAAHKALADAGLSETVQGWKDQINSLDLTKIADQQTLATMTSLKGAFDLVQTSAAGATVELRSAADILNERKGLQDQLDNLTMTSADLLDKQCNALDASNQSLFDQVQTAIAAKDATDALAASQQRIDDERLGLQDQLDQLTLSNADLLTKQSNALDASNRALFDQVTAAQAAKTAAEELTASQARIADEKRGLQDQLDNLTMTGTELLTKQRNALDASNRALFVQVTAAQAAKTAAEELAITLRTAVDDAAKGIGEAFAGVQRAVDAERKRIDASYATSAKSAQASIDSLNASVQKLATLSQALRGTLDGMQIAGSEGSARQVAQAQIAGALAIARAGGVLPDADSLRSALATVAKPSESLFKTFTEYQRDFLKTGQNIADLADITDRAQLSQQDALSLAQLQLDTLTQLHDDAVSGLDAILQKAQDQVDAANGINTSVLSIQTALVNLTSAITTLADAKTAAKIAADTPVGGTVPFTPPAGTTYNGNEIKTIQDLYTVNLGRLADAAGLAYWTAQFMADGVIDAAEKQKFAIAALPEYRAKLSAVKPFAVGTDYVAEDMIAKIHAGERIMPAADNRELMARLKNPQANNEALLAEIKALRAEVVAFRSENGAENRAMIKSTGKTALSIERVMTSPDAFLVRIATP